MHFYSVNDDYINYLHKADNKVIFNKNRPFVGPLFEIDGLKWFAPLSSVQYKSYVDPTYVWLYMIHEDSDPAQQIAKLNFRSLIPVLDCEKSDFDFHQRDQNYYNLLNKEHLFLKGHSDRVCKKALTYHRLIVGKRSNALLEKSCNFNLLLEAAKKYKN